MFCITCGNALTEDSSFCPFCGQKIASTSSFDMSSLQAQNSESNNLLQLLKHTKTILTTNKEIELVSNELKIELNLCEQIKTKEITSKKADDFQLWSTGIGLVFAIVYSYFRFATIPGWNGLLPNILTLLFAFVILFLFTGSSVQISKKIFPLSNAERLEREKELFLEAQTYYDEKCVPLIQQQELLLQQKQLLGNDISLSQIQNYIPQIYLDDISIIDSLILYFEQKRASSLKEAFNLYETEKSQKQIVEQNTAMQNDSTLKCPKCGSSDIDSITKSKSSNSASAIEGCCCSTILLPFIGWFAIPIGLCCGFSGTKTTNTESYCQCKSCGTKFQKK